MLTIRLRHRYIWWLEVIMFDEREVEEDGTVYIEKSIPLAWGCWLVITFLLFFAFIIALSVTVAQG